MKVKVSELSEIPPSIITTLVGGPCNGQKVGLHLFDGRTEINAFKQVPTHCAPYDEGPFVEKEEIFHRYALRMALHTNGASFAAFADPGMPDAEFFAACDSLRKQMHPDWFAE